MLAYLVPSSLLEIIIIVIILKRVHRVICLQHDDNCCGIGKNLLWSRLDFVSIYLMLVGSLNFATNVLLILMVLWN